MKKSKTCGNCGEVYTGKGKYCSYVCALDKSLEVGRQLREKKGPYYEKWKSRWEAATGLKMKDGG